jgi:general secretion pathway protein G
MVVLLIIGLVATLVGPRLFEQFDRSKVTAAEVQLKSLAAALDQVRLDLNRFPTDSEGLDILVKRPAGEEAWRGPYLDEDIPKDPWGNDYVYQASASGGDRPILSSLGGDGKAGGEGNDADIFSRKVRDE